MEFEKRLHKFAKVRGMSLRKVAQASGISDSMIFYYEKHPDIIPLGKARAMAKVLGISIEQIIGEKEICPNKEIAELKKENARLKNALFRVQNRLKGEMQRITSDIFPDDLE